MIDIIKQRKAELEEFINCYKDAVAKAEVKLELCNELLLNAEEKAENTAEEQPQVYCDNINTESNI